MPSTSKHLSILLVDDEAGMRSSLRRILQLDGYRIDEADTAASAIDRDNWNDYFAILLDRKLPDGSADELLPRIRKLAPHAAVLIVTGHADLESSVAALRQGAADYLLKPIEPESLRARLRGLASLRTAQIDLAKRDSQVEFIVEHLPGAAAYVDAVTEEIHFNRAIEEITGYSVEEVSTVGAFFEKLFGVSPGEVHYGDQRSLVTWTEEPRRLKVQRKDGVDIVVEFHGYSYDDHEVWLLHDVTVRDRQETELRIRDQAIQAANEGVAIADATTDDHRIVFVNKAFEAQSGFQAVDAIGNGCEILCGSNPDTAAVDMLKEAISAQREFRETIKCYRKNGDWYWNEISLAPVRCAAGNVTHIVAVMEDVTERRQAQQQHLQSERLAAIGQMVTGLAHESRNALQRAQACLDMLSLDLEQQPEQLELTEKIQRALGDLHRYYEEVRNYAAPINLQRRSTDVAALWRDTWSNLQAHQNRAQCRLVEDDVTCDTYCNIDEHRVEQVFRNVMENAIAACGPDGVLRVSCKPCDYNEMKCVCISFSDNGQGFNEESAANAFQPFFTTKQKGTGLGLAISKRIIEAHGGKVTIGQGEVCGAEVVVTLPL